MASNIKLHSEVDAASRHGIHNLSYADVGNRRAGTNETNSIVLSADNDYQIALQNDDETLWFLTDYSGPTWSSVFMSKNATVYDAVGGFEIDGIDGLSFKMTAELGTDALIRSTVFIGNEAGGSIGASSAGAIMLGGGNFTFGNTISQGADSVMLGGLDCSISTSDCATLINGTGNTIGTADYSVLLGGLNNTVSGSNAVVLGGEDNIASGSHSVAVGDNSECSGSHSIAIGNDLTVSGQYSAAICGLDTGTHTLTRDYSFSAKFKNGYELAVGDVHIGDYNAAHVSRININSDGVATSVASVYNSTGNKMLELIETVSGDGNLLLNNTAGSNKIRLIATSSDNSYINNGGYLGINTASPTTTLDVAGDTLRLRTSRTPASASASGNQGDICWDNGNLFVCIATDTWVKTELGTW